eukprot:CAMPEP_0172319742 /NCGR_PEP_ID=MMETSP1058-20130122/38609_1 /TAXON_ID=83371 /ORGANISM="Detonula confervacea, Strain CCMP 353" /LENGTH=98 /DNA_ID=CAMNT_0013034861 /DNA_START=17 /DNA_END=310 /DNA_ORIENTATION=-
MTVSTPTRSNISNIQRRENDPSDSTSRDDIIDQTSNPLHYPVATTGSVNHEPMTQATQKSEQQLPLTWNESRSRLRLTLEHWNSESNKQQRNNHVNLH